MQLCSESIRRAPTLQTGPRGEPSAKVYRNHAAEQRALRRRDRAVSPIRMADIRRVAVPRHSLQPGVLPQHRRIYGQACP